MKYQAFISYARVPDLALAAALGTSLQSFAKPWNRVRAVEVFRDQTNLASIGGLTSGITRALDESQFLILLACPESAGSYWVRQELTRWLETKKTDKIVLVLTGGRLRWDRDRADFDRVASTALPDCLRGRFSEEPLWLDLTWATRVEKPSMRDERFLNAIGEISAIIRDLPKEQLIGEDVRQHRKLLVLRRAAIATLAALTVTVAISAVIALQQRNHAVANAGRAEAASRLAQQNQALAETNERRAVAGEREAVRQGQLAEEGRVTAERERAEAERQRELATIQRNRAVSQSLASTSLLTGGEDGQLALNLAVEATRIMRTEESDYALRRAIVGDRVLDPDRVGEIYWEGSRVDAGEPIADAIRPYVARSAVGSTLVSPDGRRTASAGPSLTVRESIDAKPRVLTLSGHTDTVEALAFDRTGRFLLSGSQDQTVRLWDALTGQLLALFAHDGQIVQVAFSTDGAAIIANSRRTRRAWESRLGRSEEVLSLARKEDDHVLATKLNDLALSPNRDWAAVWGWHTTVVASTKSLAGRWTLDESTMAPVFSPDHGMLAASDMKGVSIYSLATRALRVRLQTGKAAEVMAYSDDGKLLAVAYLNSPVDIWDTTSGQRTMSLGAAHRGSLLAFDRQAHYLVVTGPKGGATVWNLATGQAQWSVPQAGRIVRVGFGPAERWVMFVAETGPARLFELRTGRALAALNHRGDRIVGALNRHRTLVALGSSYDYAGTAAGYRAPVTVWNLTTLGSAMQPERTLSGHSGAITSLDFSPDGRWLISGGLDDAVLVWDLSDGEVIDSYRLSSGGIFRAAFAADSRHIIVTDREAHVAVHECVPCGVGGDLVAAAQSKIVRPLTVEQRRRYVEALTGAR